MSAKKHSSHDAAAEFSQEQIDLLVDGELEDRSRRELLQNLDRSPEGWKRCALAFLEAQMFQQALQQAHELAKAAAASPAAADGATRTLSPVDHADGKPAKTEARDKRFLRRLPLTVVTSVAAFLLGGLVLSDFSDTFLAREKPTFVQTNPVIEPDGEIPGGELSDDKIELVSIAPMQRDEYIANMTGDSPFVAVAPKAQLKERVPRTEYVVVPTANGQGEVVVPCYLASEIQADQYLKAPALISANELSWIFPLNGEIDVQRESYVVPAGENRHAIIPVDQVIVKYTPQVDIL